MSTRNSTAKTARVAIANFPSACVTVLRELRNQGHDGQIFDLRSVLDLNCYQNCSPDRKAG